MKKILFAMALCIVCACSFAQINVQTTEDFSGYKIVTHLTSVTFPKGLAVGEIRYITNPNVKQGYYLMGVSNNQYEKSMVPIYLGESKENAIQSINDLKALLKQPYSVKSYMVDGLFGKTKIAQYDNGTTQGLEISCDGVAGVSFVITWCFYNEKKNLYQTIVDAITNFQE